MMRSSMSLDGSVLPPSRITSERFAGLARKLILMLSGRKTVALGGDRPSPQYPHRSIFFLSYAMVRLIPPFSNFFREVLDFYEIRMAHLTPNSVLTLSIFAYMCEIAYLSGGVTSSHILSPGNTTSSSSCASSGTTGSAIGSTPSFMTSLAVEALVARECVVHERCQAVIVAQAATLDVGIWESSEERITADVGIVAMKGATGDHGGRIIVEVATVAPEGATEDLQHFFNVVRETADTAVATKRRLGGCERALLGRREALDARVLVLEEHTGELDRHATSRPKMEVAMRHALEAEAAHEMEQQLQALEERTRALDA
uniref:Transposase (putative) gypsy type domain-containing protein n=1 Tax=Oryza brachyantha TaxID=4533 RepID=J3MHC7_ORYBR